MTSICACVAVPKIEIVGESDMYVKAGSTVSLKCVITQALEEPAYIFWYHNSERVLNYDRKLVDIRLERLGPDTTVSVRECSHRKSRQTHCSLFSLTARLLQVGNLIIYNPRREDSGNYSCAPSNLDSASVVLHVLSGESTAPYIIRLFTCGSPSKDEAYLLEQVRTSRNC